ncbi:acetyl-CoA C-acetyltransferase [Microbacterium sp. A93]|uniref:acetyl-CoA C-acetyltransferase n=1 Tax=Microbacterium sp. A93 TaxID=3450716 RepID=UPI003F43BE51
MPEAVIVSAARSPIGRAHKGSFAGMRADELAAQMVKSAIDALPDFDPTWIDDLMIGNSAPVGEVFHNLGRVVTVLAGLDFVPGTTVNRYCSSSLQTTRMAMHAIRAGEGSVFISAGAESVSRTAAGMVQGDFKNPRFAAAMVRSASMSASDSAWRDPRENGELPDVYIGMGLTAENVAKLHDVSREDQDAFAVRSQNRVEAATRTGFWEREITPVTLPDGTVVSKDDSPRAGVTLEAVSQLSPVFLEGGTVTAGNACPLNDGAAALVIMSDTRAKELGYTPLARVVSTGVSALSPEIMGLGPVEATRRALANARMNVSDIDLFEINEAFAAQVIASARELELDEDRLNVRGGAIALGHPFGMTGARITTTLINAMRDTDSQFGVETMCVGGGQGMAMILERLS